MSPHKRPLASSLIALALLAACSGGGSGSHPESKPAAKFTADVAEQWMAQLYDSIRAEGMSPPVASRAIAYCGVALYEAILPGMEDHVSMAGQLNELSSLPDLPKGVHYWPAVANSAIASTMRGLFATSGPIDALEAQIAGGFTVSQKVLDRSIARGTEVATHVLDWAAMDGWSVYENCAYTVPVGPGLWEPTPPGFAASPLQPCWGQMRTFALAFGAECPSLPPTTYSELVGSKFYNEAVEVQTTVDNLTQGQIDIAQFWADNPTQTGTPPGHWVSILRQVSLDQGLTLDVAAEGLCRLGIAVADAFISCWDMKYYYDLLRPITYIQSPNGLNDPTWDTCVGIGGVGTIATPAFPEHTSGHSVQSGAAAEVLTGLFGDLGFTDDTHASLGLPSRTFASFFEAADEAAISRLYAGIHFRPAIERGVEQGRCIGNLINTQIRFRVEE